MICLSYVYHFSSSDGPLFISRYARQVAEFFDFVKKKKETMAAENVNDRKGKDPKVLLPHESGLWIPKGSGFPESTQSLDFRRAMSFLSG